MTEPLVRPEHVLTGYQYAPGPPPRPEHALTPCGIVRMGLRVPAPALWINSNQRLHRMDEAKRTAAWRAAGAEAAAGLPTITRPARVIAYIEKTRAGRYDPNNLWPTVKAIMDGVVDAGVLADDDHHHLIGPDMRHGGKHPEAAVVLHFVPATPEVHP